MTYSTSGMSSPRAATSVATMRGRSLDLNCPSARSRSALKDITKDKKDKNTTDDVRDEKKLVIRRRDHHSLVAACPCACLPACLPVYQSVVHIHCNRHASEIKYKKTCLVTQNTTAPRRTDKTHKSDNTRSQCPFSSLSCYPSLSRFSPRS